MKKERKQVLGYALIVLSLIVFFLKPLASITGMAVAENIQAISSLWFYAFGLAMIIFSFHVILYAILFIFLRKPA